MTTKKKDAAVEILDGNIAKIEMTIPAKDAKQAYETSLKKISGNMTIPGFRKGKAPRQIVEKQVSVERIQTEAIESLFPKHFSKLIDESELDLATQPYIESYDFEEGKDLKLVVKAEVKPEVTLGEYKGLQVEYEEYKPEKDALEKEIEKVRERFASLVSVTDRATKSNDIITFDFEGYANGEAIEQGSAKGYTMDLANSNFIPGFAEGLAGHEIGEDFTIDVTFPENYHEEKLKAAPAQFKIKIHEIKEKTLPALDDSLAKLAGKFETLDALKEDIKTFLEKSTEAENEARKTNAAFLKAVDNVKVEIQKTMLDREIEAIKHDSQQRAMQQGIDWNKMVENEGGMAAVNEKLAFEAAERIKNTLVIEKIAKVENIEISQQDIIEQINEIAQAYGAQGAQVLEQIRNNPSSFSVITQQVATKKVRKLIADHAKFSAAKAAKETKKKS